MINFIIIVIILCMMYSIIPTLFIRMTGYGLTKKIKTEGIALTFDDGPNPVFTPQLLDLLKKYGVKASFFVVGSKVLKYPEIIKRMTQEGHTVGIHHFDHVSSWILSPSKLKKQLLMTEKAIMACTNEQATFYRPPWGHFNLFSLLVSKRYQVIMWSHIFGDWEIKTCQNGLLDQLRSVAKKGTIFVLHDCGNTLGAEEEAPKYMLEKLEVFLNENAKKRKRFVTLNELKEGARAI